MRDSVIIDGIGGPPCLLYPWASFTGYLGALRHDTISNKVFMTWPNETVDTLIYDYGLVVGDTIPGRLIDGCTMVVSSIDSVLVGTDYRRKWNFSTCNEGPGYIIQGIGSDNGLIEPMNSPGFCGTSLICLANDTTILYSSDVPSTYGCQLIYTHTDDHYNKDRFNFYPNPFSTTTVMEGDKLWGNVTLVVFNASGRPVRQSSNFDSDRIVFDREDLPGGVYSYRIYKDDRPIISNKFVIIDL
jgi:hypothetical protein